MTQLVPSEVKGVWFVAMRDYIREMYGREMLEIMLEQSSLEFREVYGAPIASAWYPEAALQEVLSLLYEVVASDSDLVFERFVEGCAKSSIHRMFQLLLCASSPGFVLRMVPTLWRQIRRGAGQVDVEQHANHTLVHYSEFPWFRDRLYLLMTLGSLRALVRSSIGAEPRIDVVEHGSDTLFLRIPHRAHEHDATSIRRASTRPPAAS